MVTPAEANSLDWKAVFTISIAVYGAVLSTVNFLNAHIRRYKVVFERVSNGQQATAYSVSFLNFQVPTYISSITLYAIIDSTAKIIKIENIKQIVGSFKVETRDFDITNISSADFIYFVIKTSDESALIYSTFDLKTGKRDRFLQKITVRWLQLNRKLP